MNNLKNKIISVITIMSTLLLNTVIPVFAENNPVNVKVDISDRYNRKGFAGNDLWPGHHIDVDKFKAGTSQYSWKEEWVEGKTDNILVFNGKEYYISNIYEDATVFFRNHDNGNSSVYNVDVEDGYYNEVSILATDYYTGSSADNMKLAVRFNYRNEEPGVFVTESLPKSGGTATNGFEVSTLKNGGTGVKYIGEYVFPTASDKVLESIDILPRDGEIDENGALVAATGKSKLYETTIFAISARTNALISKVYSEIRNEIYEKIETVSKVGDVSPDDYHLFMEIEDLLNYYLVFGGDISKIDENIYGVYIQKSERFYEIISESHDYNVYVSPLAEDDGNGTLEKPFNSVKDAVFYAEKVSKRYGLKGNFRVNLLDGEYDFREALSLSNINPNKNLKIVLLGEENVCFKNSISLSANDFTKNIPAEIKSMLSIKAKDKVVCLNLSDKGINLSDSIFASNNLYKGLGLYVNDNEQQVSEYPNNRYEWVDTVSDGKIIDKVFSGFKSRDSVSVEGFFGNKYELKRYYGSVSSSDNSLTVPTIAKTDDRWKIINAPEVIDVPGEWCVDASNGMLYYYPTDDFYSFGCVISNLSQPIVEINNCSNLVLENISFKNTVNIAVKMNGCDNVTIKNCSFKNVGSGIMNEVTNCENLLIDSNEFENIGYTGVRVLGGNVNTLELSGNMISNNVFNNLSTYRKTYAPAVRVAGVGNKVYNNLMSNSTHCMIQFSGSLNEIKYNKLFNACTDTADCGAIYSGRDMTWHGNEIAYNHIENVLAIDERLVDELPGGLGIQCGVYLDDRLGGTNVHHNYIKNAVRGIFVGAGSYNTIEYNVLDNCMQPVRNSTAKRMPLSQDTLALKAIQFFNNNPVYYDTFDYLSVYRQFSVDSNIDIDEYFEENSRLEPNPDVKGVYDSETHGNYFGYNIYSGNENNCSYQPLFVFTNKVEKNTVMTDIKAALEKNEIDLSLCGTNTDKNNTVNLIYPPNNTEVFDWSQFCWEKHPDVNNYIFEISDTQGFEKVIYKEETRNNYIENIFFDNKDCYWRVRADDKIFSPVYKITNRFPLFLDNVILKNENGESVFDIADAKSIKVCLTQNNIDESVIIAAVYENEKLIKCIICENGKETALTDIGDGNNLSVMVFDSLGSIKPLTLKNQVIYGE